MELDLDYYDSLDQVEQTPIKMNRHDRRRRLDHDGGGYSGSSGYSAPVDYYTPVDNQGVYMDPYCQCEMSYA